MSLTDVKSNPLADRLLSLSGSDIGQLVEQLHPEDLAAAWRSMPPWACALAWQRYRRSLGGGR
jgi:hypothetical protein